jgi:hypothetical protein
MGDKSKEKKDVEDISEEELLKTKHGMAANRPKGNEANSESAPDEI